jgi:5-methyltetrahydrofolate--homocysteine methyltransferase
MEKSESGNNAKGTFVIATVKGDVHDIGKNLVDIILSNNGYKVINLGIKQSVENIIQAYEQYQPDCIAMSGLLVKSTAFMKENLQTFNEKGITVPVILGGAALTPKFVNQDCQGTYKGKVIYGKDAFSDLHFMDKLMPAKIGGNWDDLQGFLDEVAENGHELVGKKGGQDAHPTIDNVEIKKEVDTRRSDFVPVDIERPKPPFWGTQFLEPDDISLEELFWYLDLQALVAGQWQFRKPKEQSKEEYQGFLADKVYPVLEVWKGRIIEENLLHPHVIYGYFPCQSVGNSLLIYETNHGGTEDTEVRVGFEFPRQKSLNRLCIADFFAPKESGIIDVFPMQAVTVGEVATEFAQKLFANNQYTDYLYFHGMAVQVAEALAEWTHARIRRELGFGDSEPDNIRDILAQRYQGSRYSFGYPACPNIQDQFKQLELLGVDRMKMRMDESEQLYPEQSTTAIITYHPVAKYFTA